MKAVETTTLTDWAGTGGRHLKAALAGIATLLVLSCSEQDSTSVTLPADGGSSTEGGAATANGGSSTGNGGAASDGARCSPPEGTSGNPKTIYEVLDLVNGLPHPVQLPCLLETLDRPLSLNANFNTQSAQPALGKRSPRIFVILNGSLSMSLVPGADPTLEFGERNASEPGFSVKGELHFPVQDQLVPEDAFARLAPGASTGLTLDQATKCGVCHDNEKPAPDYPVRGAFTSAVVKPTSFFAVEVDDIERERDTCDAALEPERCAVLHALFDHGDVVQTAFP